MYKDLVIVQVDRQKDSFIAAFRLKDGKPAWRTEREEIPSWGSPTVYQGPPRDEVVTHGTKFIRAYDPATGKELWRLGPNSEITTPTPIVAHGLIFVTNGYSGIQPIYAIKPGGSGDLTLAGEATSSPFIAWSAKRGGVYTPTPVVYEDLLYLLSNQGVLSALRRAHRRARLPGARGGEGRRVQRVAGRGRRQALPGGRGRRRLRGARRPQARVARDQPDGRGPHGDAPPSRTASCSCAASSTSSRSARADVFGYGRWRALSERRASPPARVMGVRSAAARLHL